MVKLIGLAGRAKSGKSTAAEVLAELGYARYAFAAPVKSLVRHFLSDQGLSEADITWHEQNKDWLINGFGLSIRELWQRLGTEWGRGLVDEKTWVWAADHYIRRYMESQPKGKGVVVEDVRFENEADYIRAHGGAIVHVRREVLRRRSSDLHPSEAGIEMKLGDHLLCNDGGLDVFVNSVKVWALR